MFNLVIWANGDAAQSTVLAVMVLIASPATRFSASLSYWPLAMGCHRFCAYYQLP